MQTSEVTVVWGVGLSIEARAACGQMRRLARTTPKRAPRRCRNPINPVSMFASQSSLVQGGPGNFLSKAGGRSKAGNRRAWPKRGLQGKPPTFSPFHQAKAVPAKSRVKALCSRRFPARSGRGEGTLGAKLRKTWAFCLRSKRPFLFLLSARLELSARQTRAPPVLRAQRATHALDTGARWAPARRSGEHEVAPGARRAGPPPPGAE